MNVSRFRRCAVEIFGLYFVFDVRRNPVYAQTHTMLAWRVSSTLSDNGIARPQFRRPTRDRSRKNTTENPKRSPPCRVTDDLHRLSLVESAAGLQCVRCFQLVAKHVKCSTALRTPRLLFNPSTSFFLRNFFTLGNFMPSRLRSPSFFYGRHISRRNVDRRPSLRRHLSS